MIGGSLIAAGGSVGTDTDTDLLGLSKGLLTINGGGLNIGDGNITTGSLKFGTATSSGTYNILDGSLCVGDGGSCTPSSTDGRLFVVNSINVGDTTPNDVAYNTFGGGSDTLNPGSGAMNGSEDVYIRGDLEVDGTAYYKATAWSVGDIAENINTKASRKNTACNGNVACYKNNTNDNLDYGDLVCIDTSEAHTIKKCSEANSYLAVGFVTKQLKFLSAPLMATLSL